MISIEAKYSNCLFLYLCHFSDIQGHSPLVCGLRSEKMGDPHTKKKRKNNYFFYACPPQGHKNSTFIVVFSFFPAQFFFENVFFLFDDFFIFTHGKSHTLVVNHPVLHHLFAVCKLTRYKQQQGRLSVCNEVIKVLCHLMMLLNLLDVIVDVIKMLWKNFMMEHFEYMHMENVSIRYSFLCME